LEHTKRGDGQQHVIHEGDFHQLVFVLPARKEWMQQELRRVENAENCPVLQSVKTRKRIKSNRLAEMCNLSGNGDTHLRFGTHRGLVLAANLPRTAHAQQTHKGPGKKKKNGKRSQLKSRKGAVRG